MTKSITSIRINQDVINHLKNLNINISNYINDLIIEDLTKKSFENTKLKKVLTSAILDEKKTLIINELKIVGAINNIPTRLKNISKENEQVFHILLKKNLELLEIEYSQNYSKDTKNLIKTAYKELQNLNIEIFEPYEKIKKLK